MEPQIYLNFNGRCEEAMRFYADLFGGTVGDIFRNSDADPKNRMDGDDNAVMNMAITLGNATMMASDVPDQYYSKPNGFSVTMQADSVDQAQRWFDALKQGGEVRMDLQQTFWAERFAMLTDRYGTPWMINYDGGRRRR